MAKRIKTGGRKAGTPNKVTKALQESFEQVFNQLQNSNTASLHAWAQQNPTEFYKLASKLIPLDGGGGNSPMVLPVVTGVPKPTKTFF